MKNFPLQIVTFVLLIISSTTFSAENRLWLGKGLGEGTINVSDKERIIFGPTHEIVFHRTGNWGIVSGFGLMDVEINNDLEFNSNDVQVHYRNLAGYFLLGLKFKLSFMNIGGHEVFGVSETTFGGKITRKSGSENSFERKKDNSLFRGREVLLMFDLENDWIFGLKYGIFNRRLDLSFRDLDADIKQDKNYLIFLGTKWGGQNKKKGKKKKK